MGHAATKDDQDAKIEDPQAQGVAELNEAAALRLRNQELVEGHAAKDQQIAKLQAELDYANEVIRAARAGESAPE